MADTFNKDVPEEFIQENFQMMKNHPENIFQVLTKRSERLKEIAPRLEWTDNIWQGVTVEAEEYVHRIDDLRSTDAKVKFLSMEPLLSAVPNLNLDGIDWVIVGGESGSGWREIKEEWVLDIMEQW